MSRYTLTLEFDELPHLNVARDRHWRHRQREAREWWNRVYWHLKTNPPGWPDMPLTCAQLQAVRISSAAPDFDNLVVSFKPVIDALTTCCRCNRHAVRCKCMRGPRSVLCDDSMKVLPRPEYLWDRAATKAEQGIRVTITGEGR